VNGLRILLTGSSGWLGRHLAPLLAQVGHEVVGLDPAPGEHSQIRGSVADRALIDRILAEHAIEAVIHAGALHKPDIARYPAQAFVGVNVTGTLNLLEAAAAAGHDRFLFTSTTSLMITEAISAGAPQGEPAKPPGSTRASARCSRATSTALPSWLPSNCAA
jgi:nucleoside-diphosphate-sugar epimerase